MQFKKKGSERVSKFDYMSFSGGNDTEFVAHAKKYSKEQTIELCIGENDYRFEDGGLRTPTISDIDERTVKYFIKVPEYCGYDGEGGCYTYCKKDSKGSFPVWSIDFSELR
jgi:hypothetical protein